MIYSSREEMAASKDIQYLIYDLLGMNAEIKYVQDELDAGRSNVIGSQSKITRHLAECYAGDEYYSGSRTGLYRQALLSDIGEMIGNRYIELEQFYAFKTDDDDLYMDCTTEIADEIAEEYRTGARIFDESFEEYRSGIRVYEKQSTD